MTIKPEADDCPFCYSPDQWVWEPGPGLKAVACGNKRCNATGPVSDNVEDATRLWNVAPRGPLRHAS